VGPQIGKKVYVLSPANVSGERGRRLLWERTQLPLAQALQSEGAPVGEVFQFISGLYFRGKLVYAQAFSNPPAGHPGSLVIVPGRGLLPPDTLITLTELREIASVPVEPDEPRYRAPLERDARLLFESAGSDTAMILLGSVATTKYVEPLLDVFGGRLLFPLEFVGRGDMSRGGLMLRCAAARTPLTYVPAHQSARRGTRPPRLPRKG